jgi:hypothetical protein
MRQRSSRVYVNADSFDPDATPRGCADAQTRTRGGWQNLTCTLAFPSQASRAPGRALPWRPDNAMA